MLLRHNTASESDSECSSDKTRKLIELYMRRALADFIATNQAKYLECEVDAIVETMSERLEPFARAYCEVQFNI